MESLSNRKWIAIGLGVLITFWASSIKGSYQVYFLDLVALSESSRGLFSLSSALFGLSIGVLSPVVGWICDRLGPALTILSGVAVALVTYLIMLLPFHFWVFLVLFGVLAAYALTAMTFVPLALLVDRIFEHKHKGLAYAAITNGTAIGFMVLSPVWVWLHTFLSWQEVSLVIVLVFAVAIFPASIWLCKAFPRQVFKPSSTSSGEENVAWHRYLYQPLFMLLALSFGGCGASMAYIDVHLVPLLQERFSGGGDVIVATSLSVLGAAELAGAFIVGYLLRSSAPALLLSSLYAMRALALLVVLFADSMLMCVIFAVLFGLSYMGTVIVTSFMCLRAYGEEVKGKIFGCLFTVHQLFAFAIIWLGGFSYDWTHSYQWVTLVVIGLCVLSSATGIIFYRSPTLKDKSPITTPA